MRESVPIQFRRVSSLLLKLTILFALASPYAMARAGGGGGDDGGGLLWLILAPFVIAYAWYVNRRINKKKKATEQLLNTLSQDDPAWKEADLEAHARETFFQIEVAWCKQDLAQLESLLHPQLFSEWKAQIELMQSNGERNIMEGLRIDNVRLVEAQNYRDKEKDIFTACIDAAPRIIRLAGTGKSSAPIRGAGANRQIKKSLRKHFASFGPMSGTAKNGSC